MSAFSSKLSSDARTVVPKRVREHLQLRPGDMVRYRFTASGVILEKADPAIETHPFSIFSEWATAEDEAAFASL